MQYYFILGKNPPLSKAEIEAVLENLAFGIKNSELFGNVFFVEIDKEIDINRLNQKLGGTVKIGLVLDTVKELADFSDKFFQYIEYGPAKAYFGFSIYSLSPKANLAKIQRQLTPLAMEIKRKLREEKKINSRYVVSREIELSSVIVQKNKLLKNGAEICFFVKDEEIIFGQTLAVQEFEEFGARDYTRPSRDQVSGMLPPKLARIMINLAQVKEDKIILDPFCGSGTILQEAVVLGYQHLIGFDKSAKAVGDSQQNLAWLKERFKQAPQSLDLEVLAVEELSQKMKQAKISAIVTEPFLGPPMRGHENMTQIEMIVKDLEKLYQASFVQFAKILKPGAKVVMIFPVFKIHNHSLKLNLDQAITKLGFKLLNNNELFYYRPKQLVWRQIMIYGYK